MKVLTVSTFFLIISGCFTDPHRQSRKYIDAGNAYFAQGKYVEASNAYAKAIDKDRMSGDAYYGAGITAIKLKRWSEAVSHLQRAVDLQPALADAYSKLIDIYLLTYSVETRLQKPVVEELKTLAAKLKEQVPGSYDDARVSGFIALFSNDTASALANFSKANALRPHQEDVALAYMRTLAAIGQPAAAEKLGKETIAGNPSALRVYDELLWQYVRAQRSADIEQILQSKVRNHTGLIEAHLELAAHYFTTGRRPEMLTVLKNVADQRAHFPDGRLQVGDFFLRIREFPVALEHYERGIQEDSGNKVRYQKRMVEALLKLNRAVEAEQLIAEVLKSQPSDAEAVAIRASVWVTSEKSEKLWPARTDFDRIMAQMPDDYVLRYLFGRAALLTGGPATGDLAVSGSTETPARLPLASNLTSSNRDRVAAIRRCHSAYAGNSRQRRHECSVRYRGPAAAGASAI
jgi:tetratricopeptide (TPR) repeat protein